jgi:hypothetical protein
MKLKKNRILTKKELIQILLLLTGDIPVEKTADGLFTVLMEESKKPPFPPPPGLKKKV